MDNIDIAISKNIASNCRLVSGGLFVLSILSGMNVAALVVLASVALAILSDLAALGGHRFRLWVCVVPYGLSACVFFALLIRFYILGWI
ncbi:hypothetical protein HF263_03005 [Rhizobium leguminosarum]|uniref:hypothetical protein n=1 Tax=Rhizobium leguminosarum TaxID=384 RepID=UPI001C91571E|nr:hypothetical protein [Rhizobium leguminosarum]MBY3055048.1 hypothetical protein [Rhizobium leguminosarum]